LELWSEERVSNTCVNYQMKGTTEYMQPRFERKFDEDVFNEGLSLKTFNCSKSLGINIHVFFVCAPTNAESGRISRI
jgi:hypothetical protein